MNEKKAKILIREGETLTVEFKTKYTSRIDEDIVAFANTKGGTLFLGVHDDGSIAGEHLTNDLKAKINSLTQNCKPPISANISRAGKVVAIEVPEGTDKPYSCSSGYFRRLNGTTQKMSHEEIKIMFRECDIIPFEERTVKRFSLHDVSKSKINTFIKEAGISVGRIATLDFLRSLKVSDDAKVKNAGILFFAKNVQDYLPQAQITMVAFKGTDKFNIYDRHDVRDDLLTQLNEAMAFIKKHINVRSEIIGINRRDIYEIPLEAIREAVVNALMHRDYSVMGTQINVEIYDDRVEIINPGGLPRGLSKKAFGTMSVRRNEIIADMFFRIHKVERLGMGIKRMRKMMREAGLKEPEFDANGFFKAVFYRSPELAGIPPRITPQETPQVTPQVPPQVPPKVTLTELESRILKVIAQNPRISRNKLADALKIGPDTVKEYINKLKKKGVLRRIGKTSGGYWEIVK